MGWKIFQKPKVQNINDWREKNVDSVKKQLKKNKQHLFRDFYS